MTLFGTRPEIIRLSVIIKRLDCFCEQVLVHTGQNYDENLSDIFFRELNLRHPDVYMGVRAPSFAARVGQIITRTGDALDRIQPDRLLVLGDTHSGLGAIIAARHGVPVFHLEAGNRCYDDRVPEETNRRIIDHCSNVLMPYTHRSKENLLREGIERERIFVVGNPIYEVLSTHGAQIDTTNILDRLGLRARQYFLVTMHRAENVDIPARLEQLWQGLALVADTYRLPIIVSLHPHTADQMHKSGLGSQSEQIQLLAPLGLFDFVHLERSARCVLSDSGTVQEECCIYQVPNVTIRDVTERAETIECGSNILTGGDPEAILHAVGMALNTTHSWAWPGEYMVPNVADTVTKIVLGYHHHLQGDKYA